MIKILFICHGNICRSPLAEYLLKDLVKKKGIEDNFFISSKATSTEEIGNAIYPPIKKLLNNLKIDASSHRASQIKKEDYDDYDYLIVMDSNNLRNAMKIFKDDPNNKIGLLMEYTAEARDVLDPWYTRNFDACYQDIEKGLKGLLKKLGY